MSVFARLCVISVALLSALCNNVSGASNGVRIPPPPVFVQSKCDERRLLRRSPVGTKTNLIFLNESSELRLGRPFMKLYYVYIMQSETNPERFYTGFTDNLKVRLKSHNQGKCVHTSKFVPWRIKTAIAFTDYQKALDFEKYLKTSSGRAFTKKRL